VVEICAVNVGHRTLEIRELGFKDEYGTTLSEKFDTPSKVEPGTSIERYFPYEEVLKNLDTFTSVFAEDTSRRSYSDDMSSFAKDRIRYQKAVEMATTLVRSLSEFDSNMERIEQAREGALKRLDEINSDFDTEVEEIQRKHQEWDDYHARTGEMHPEQRAYIDNIVRQVKQRDDKGANTEQEDSERR